LPLTKFDTVCNIAVAIDKNNIDQYYYSRNLNDYRMVFFFSTNNKIIHSIRRWKPKQLPWLAGLYRSRIRKKFTLIWSNTKIKCYSSKSKPNYDVAYQSAYDQLSGKIFYDLIIIIIIVCEYTSSLIIHIIIIIIW
jgi:hypothetical protein